MKTAMVGLVWMAGVSGFVHGFVFQSQVTHKRAHIPLHTSSTGLEGLHLYPLARQYQQTSRHSLLLREREGCRYQDGQSDRPVQKRRSLFRLAKLGTPQKAALLAAAAATASQFFPHAAVAAENTLPLVSAAVGNPWVEKLTSSGFFQAFSLVFVSEIGDKTFFIAALLAAKTSRLISFAGSVGALAVMTVLAVLLGLAFHSVPTVFTSGLPLDDIVAAAAFLYFGVITLRDAYKLPDDSNVGIDEEKAEAEESIKELEGKKTAWSLVLQTFSLVFAAEFGDRSFLTTIALGAAQNPWGVGTGAIAAHASATGVAVTGGALLSQYISEKVIGYIGGALFVAFSVTTILGIF